MYLHYLCVQNFIPVFQKVHEQDPQLFGAGAEVVMAAQCLRWSHLEIKKHPFNIVSSQLAATYMHGRFI